MFRLDDGVRPPTAAEKLIFRWDSSASSGFDDSCFRMLFDGDNKDEAQRYLRAVDEVRRTSMRRRDSFGSSSGSGGGIGRSASVALQAAMARLEEEARHILFTRASPYEVDALFDFGSLSLNSSASIDFTAEGSASGSDFRRGRITRRVSSRPSARDEDEDEVEGVYGEEEEDQNPDEEDQQQQDPTLDSSSSIPARCLSSMADIDLLPPDAVNDLRSIAEQMVAAGYARECFQAFTSARKAAIETVMQQLGTDRFTPGDVHRLPWEMVESRMRRWIRATRLCVRCVFASERRLCDLIFEGLKLDAEADESEIQLQSNNRRRNLSFSGSWTPETPFLDTVKSSVNLLLGFADAVSTGPRSPEKLFKLLDFHDALNDLIPDIEYVFRTSIRDSAASSPSQPTDSVSVQAAAILARLADAIRAILSEFESAVHNEVSRVAVPGGNLHPLTRYVMNYISLITDYKQSLVNIIVSSPSPEALLRTPSDNQHTPSPPPPDVDFRTIENQTPLSQHLVWIIAILDANLEFKSRLYRDPSLTSIFVLNNAHYIVNKVKTSPDMLELIGNEFLKRLKGKYQQAATAYQRSTWQKVLLCLREEGLHPTGGFSSGTSKTTLRERFKAFNAAFEEAHRTQSTWSVPDPQLKQELRISIAARLLPAYRAFLGRYAPIIENGRHPELYIKYTVEQLETDLDDFFESSGPPSKRH